MMSFSYSQLQSTNIKTDIMCYNTHAEQLNSSNSLQVHDNSHLQHANIIPNQSQKKIKCRPKKKSQTTFASAKAETENRQ